MELTITNIPAISAIYYALLQCGYEFYAIERDAATVEALRGFLLQEGIGCDFFAGYGYVCNVKGQKRAKVCYPAVSGYEVFRALA